LDVTLTGFKHESDQDYHLTLLDPSGATMIAEIPDPAVVDRNSRLVSQIASARDAFSVRFQVLLASLAALQAGPQAPGIVDLSIHVVLTGVGFYDFLHGATDQAPNGVELHPVLSIEFP
jgi:hypothetical protein